MSQLSVFMIGVLGGLLHEINRWIGLRHQGEMPIYISKIHYWLLTLLLGAVGGIVAVIFDPKQAYEALYFGVTAPALLSRLVTLAPPTLKLGKRAEGVEVSEPAIQNWLRG